MTADGTTGVGAAMGPAGELVSDQHAAARRPQAHILLRVVRYVEAVA